MIDRLNDPQYTRWATQIRANGGCLQPIHLRGRVLHIDPSTGAVVHRYTTLTEPGGVLRVACKTRRASRCPSCAATYRADTYHLIRAGLIGGKGVPASVAEHPAVFVTLTAPSFGLVHTRALDKRGQTMPCRARRETTTCAHERPLACPLRHSADDPRLGEPLCTDCYDYTGSILFNALAPQLWHRFVEALRRHLSRNGGLTVREFRQQAVISFAKVAEYQKRGVVHLHAIIRIDGPDGPTSTPPRWVTLELLAHAIAHAYRAVSITTPTATDLPSRQLRWGQQIDIQPITADGDLSESAVAAYVAKYATKAAESVGVLDRPIYPLEDLAALHLRPHARRLIAECLRLGVLDELADLRLTAWAHMLGFRGHFSTRSRHYGPTLGDLRAIRAEHQRRNETPPDDTVSVISQWAYAGRGLSAGDRVIAVSLRNGTP
ncbi:replication initiation protein [Streptosporangiaceae bacterium NEAU-GS5]|nr:replication initiation protein [Streptosporangiaceae bacterium NEAU-GS5]